MTFIPFFIMIGTFLTVILVYYSSVLLNNFKLKRAIKKLSRPTADDFYYDNFNNAIVRTTTNDRSEREIRESFFKDYN